ncbi:MAG: replicative DNA helicase [Acidobacteria bacterium]|nr:replicative DNA helicase [Acidobacteriota bacterium]
MSSYPEAKREQFLERPLPSSEDSERAILGAILLDNSLITQTIEHLRPEDFYSPLHRRIYGAMVSLFDASRSIDPILIGEELKKNGSVESIGGVAAIANLTYGLPHFSDLSEYIKVVRGKSLMRSLIRTCNEITSEALDEEDDAEVIIDRAEQMVFALAEQKDRQGFEGIRPIAENVFSKIQDFAQRESHALTGLATGYRDLDNITSGLQSGDLIIVAARPSMGKTALCLNIAQRAAVRENAVVAVFSLEMSKEQLVMRMLSAQASVDARNLRLGILSAQDWGRLAEAIADLSSTRLFIDDTPGISVLEMRAKLRRLAVEQKSLDLIVVDYLQLMGGGGKRNENRQQEVSQISRDLKALAKEFNCPVIALSQLSRAPEARNPPRPMMSDLRESGCLVGDTLVTMADTGERVPIRDLVGKKGFYVWSLDQNTWKIKKGAVTNAFSTGMKPVFDLTTRLGRSITATGNHKFLTFNGWKRLDQLSPDDLIAIPRHIQNTTSQSMSNSELALLAHLIGDGCLLPNHAIQYTTREHDLAVIVSDLASEVFGDKIKPRINPERNWYQVYLASTRHHTHNTRSALAIWADELGVWGLRSYEKFVPKKVFFQPPDAIALFLRHLWVTDGCIKKPRTQSAPAVYYASSSRNLASDVQHLLLRLGINATLRRIPQNGKGRDQYHVIVTGKADLEIFAGQIGAVGAYKLGDLNAIKDYLRITKGNTNRDVIPKGIWQEMVLPRMSSQAVTHRQFSKMINTQYCGSSLYKQNIGRDRAKRVADALDCEEIRQISQSDVYWDKVAEIVPKGEAEVFDLTVEEFANFEADGIVVHNSIEQDADVVAFIFRQDYYSKNPDEIPENEQNIAELIIAKQRNGPTDTIKLAFLKQFTRFEDVYFG